jgi:hypothetical protein
VGRSRQDSDDRGGHAKRFCGGRRPDGNAGRAGHGPEARRSLKACRDTGIRDGAVMSCVELKARLTRDTAQGISLRDASRGRSGSHQPPLAASRCCPDIVNRECLRAVAHFQSDVRDVIDNRALGLRVRLAIEIALPCHAAQSAGFVNEKSRTVHRFCQRDIADPCGVTHDLLRSRAKRSSSTRTNCARNTTRSKSSRIWRAERVSATCPGLASADDRGEAEPLDGQIEATNASMTGCNGLPATEPI